MPSFTVPVTIKSLVFGADPRVPHSITSGERSTITRIHEGRTTTIIITTTTRDADCGGP